MSKIISDSLKPVTLAGGVATVVSANLSPQQTKTGKLASRFDSHSRPNLDLYAGMMSAFAILSYVVLYGIYWTHGFSFGVLSWSYGVILVPIWVIDGFKSLLESFMPTSYKFSAEDLSKVTVIIPCKDGEDVIAKTLAPLVRRFSNDQIIVVSNGSTDNTASICRKQGVRVLNIKGVGKVRAINYGLRFVRTPYVLLLDDDTLVNRTRIPTGLLDQGYDAVAFRVLVLKSTWVTLFQAYEYRKSVDIGKRYHNRRASVLNVSGAIGLFRLSELKRQIALHTAEFSGEDLQRTLLVHLSLKPKGVVLVGATVFTVPPNKLLVLFKQRVFGWYPGLFANFGNYLRIMTRRHAPMTLRLEAFYNAFGIIVLDVFRLLSLPILVLYPWYFIIMYLAYVMLELITYVRSGMKEPLWVVLLYPLYGLFGFITRVCAFAVLLYRRLSCRLSGSEYFDDYRSARRRIKALSTAAVILAVEVVLLASDRYGLAAVLMNWHFK